MRMVFRAKQPELDVQKLIFIDEAGMRMGETNRYGWSVCGDKVHGHTSAASWKTRTMISAIGLDGFKGFMNICSGTSIDVFSAFVKHELVPNLKPGNIVVMDNLSAHKHASIIEQIEAVGVKVLFLPPYSPDFNPIERMWAKLKQIVRRLESNTVDKFDEAVAFAMDQIKASDIKGWFNFCGFQVKE